MANSKKRNGVPPKVERQLETCNNRFQELAKLLPAVVFEIDLQGNFLFLSDYTYQLFGYSTQEIEEGHLTVMHMFTHESRKQLMANIDRRLKGEDLGPSREYMGRRKDGSEFPLEVFSAPIIEHGQVTGFRGVALDMSERRAAEENLHRWVNRYELSVAASGQVAYDYNVQTGAILWGKTVEKVLGYTDSEMGQGFDQWIKLLHPEDRQPVLEYLEDAEKKGAYWDTQYRLLHKDKRYIWIRDRGFFIIDEAGKAVRRLGMLEDVTELRTASELLRENETRYREMFNNMKGGAAVFTVIAGGEDFVFKDLNKGAQMIEQLRKDEVLGKSLAEIFPAAADVGLLDLLRRVWESGVAEPMPPRYYKDDLRRGWREYFAYKLETGELVLIFDDVSERMEILAELNESQERFLGIVENSQEG
ncbi:MAG: PAS domain S-box protein, partial [Smithellaceae bacterium]|nr:PAS domain S-box protein [Smithellaceae bacterium]